MKIHSVVIELLRTDTVELIGTFLLLLGARALKSDCGSELSASAVTQMQNSCAKDIRAEIAWSQYEFLYVSLLEL
jgi:hypothetical protein